MVRHRGIAAYARRRQRSAHSGGIEVRPGDIVVGDLDGVVVVPRGTAGQVLKMAQEIDQRELEKARLIVQARSRKEGLAKYGRI